MGERHRLDFDGPLPFPIFAHAGRRHIEIFFLDVLIAHKLLGLRVFSDEAGKMYLNVQQVEGGLLLVPQFTLMANTTKGLRPGFDGAAPPAHGEALFDYLVAQARHAWPYVATGEFGADMQVSLLNDGPVTFIVET